MQPEDAAKDVNLKPPGFFVASTASQRQCEGPASPEVPVEKAGAPPVVIVSYGSSSSPTVANFHHGFYSLAQPEVAHVQHVSLAAQSWHSITKVLSSHSMLLYCIVVHVQAQPYLLPDLCEHAWLRT